LGGKKGFRALTPGLEVPHDVPDVLVEATGLLEFLVHFWRLKKWVPLYCFAAIEKESEELGKECLSTKLVVSYKFVPLVFCSDSNLCYFWQTVL
jgi:hypothetical protein